MEKKENVRQNSFEGFQNALTNVIDSRVNFAKNILSSVQSSLESTTSTIKETINGEKENSIINCISSAINKRAKMVDDVSETIVKKKETKEKE